MGTYINRGYLEDAYGPTNIKQWANSERDGTPDSDLRIERAIDIAIGRAEGEFEAALMRGKYIVPVETTTGTAFDYIRGIVGAMATYYLYSRRGIQDTAAGNAMVINFQQARSELSQIQSGEKNPGLVRRSNETDSPFVVTNGRAADGRRRNRRLLRGDI